MKIFFVIDSLQTGGSEKSTLEIISRLPKDIDPTIVVIYDRLDLLHKYADSEFKIVNFNLKGKYEFQKAIGHFKKLCKEERPDIVVATLFRAEMISRIVCKMLHIKNIGTFVNDTYSKYELSSLAVMMRIKVSTLWVLNRITASWCYRFLANSESIKRSNARNLMLPINKIDVIYRGRDVSSFKFQVENRLTKPDVHFLNIGRLLQRKGQLELIRAFYKFHQHNPGSTLSIAGEGHYRDRLEVEIKKLKLEKNVFLLGNINNVSHLLSTCDLFVFSSYFEGFSGALVEAMLAGAPIIASDIEMNKEAVAHMDTALLFEVKNEASLFKMMNYAVSNKELMKEMAKKARREAVEKYDIDKIALQHALYYRKLLQE